MRTFTALGSALLAVVTVACSAALDDEPSGPPTFGNVGGSTGNPTSAQPGNMSPSGQGTSGSSGSELGGSSNPPIVNNGSGNNSGNGSQTGNGGTSNSTPSATGSGGSAPGSGGTSNEPPASGGSASEPPPAGSGGTQNQPPPNNNGGTQGQPPANNGGSASEPPAPTEPDIDCPAGASFCSGFEFEGNLFPAGTRFHSVGPGLPNPFSIDGTDTFAGERALVIPATNSGGFFYRALAVPVPGQEFWVRLYMNLSSTLGDNSHDSVFGASSGAITADVNGEALVELSEQFNRVLLNTDDALFNPTVGSTISPNVWHCMEAHYDGGSGDVQIFVDGDEIINAPGYRRQTYQSFRIGYMRYNDDRTVRFDDVIVAPDRVGCD